jgi:hypothetical protein
MIVGLTSDVTFWAALRWMASHRKAVYAFAGVSGSIGRHLPRLFKWRAQPARTCVNMLYFAVPKKGTRP